MILERLHRWLPEFIRILAVPMMVAAFITVLVSPLESVSSYGAFGGILLAGFVGILLLVMYHLAWHANDPRFVRMTNIWLGDLFTSSYYATTLYRLYPHGESGDWFQVVAKTRGGRQYFQSRETLLFDLDMLDEDGEEFPVICASEAMAVERAKALNRALSVQRKTVAGLVLLFIGVVLEAGGIDISLLT